MSKNTLYAFIIAAITCVSCREDADDLESVHFIKTDDVSLLNNAPKTYTEQFEAFWNGMNQNYVGWALEDFDWDKVYAENHAIPEEWDARVDKNPNDTISDKEFKAFYDKICLRFHDHHLCMWLWNLRTPSRKDIIFNPREERMMQRENFNTLDYVDDVRIYCATKKKKSLWYYALRLLNEKGQLEPIDGESYIVFDKGIEDEFYAELCVIKAGNGKYIPFLHWSRFMFADYLKNEKKSGTLNADGTASKFLETYGALVKKYGEAGQLGGVILDVRSNTGGEEGDFTYLLGRLLKPGTEMVLGSVVRKSGVGRLDYCPSTPFGFAIADLNQYPVTKEPIVVLCDGMSGSMSEVTAYAAKLLPNGHVIGERTGGGFNYLDMTYDNTYSGSFGDKVNGPIYVFAPCALYTPIDGTKLESVGVVPDEEIPYNDEIMHAMTDDLTCITDAHIEAAIKYIQEKH